MKEKIFRGGQNGSAEEGKKAGKEGRKRQNRFKKMVCCRRKFNKYNQETLICGQENRRRSGRNMTGNERKRKTDGEI